MGCWTEKERKREMDETTVKIVSAVLAVILLGIVVMRRKAKGKSGGEDEF